jgi:hypothetical protein
VKLPAEALARNPVQDDAAKTSVGPAGFFESRVATVPDVNATSTQFEPLLLRLDFRHVVGMGTPQSQVSLASRDLIAFTESAGDNAAEHIRSAA